MQHTFRLPALDADVVIDGDTVTITNNDGETIQVSADEWKMLRKKWRFDNVVDYKSGETPMTLYQFRICVELTRQIKNQEAEIERLKANRLTSPPQTAQS